MKLAALVTAAITALPIATPVEAWPCTPGTASGFITVGAQTVCIRKMSTAEARAANEAARQRRANEQAFLNAQRTQPQATQPLGTSVSGNIRNRCDTKWGTDYEMVQYCVENQTEAAQKLGY